MVEGAETFLLNTESVISPDKNSQNSLKIF